jgi:ketosteroid isomerase-like protein
MSQENVEVVLRIHRAVARGDLDGLLAEVHPSGEYRAVVQQAMQGEGAVFRGHAGMARWLADLQDLYEGLESEVVETRDLGDQVVVAFVVRATARQSGITLEQPLAQLVTLRDGKAVEVRDFRSLDEALEAVASRHGTRPA